jgi:hypothetical protein
MNTKQFGKFEMCLMCKNGGAYHIEDDLGKLSYNPSTTTFPKIHDPTRPWYILEGNERNIDKDYCMICLNCTRNIERKINKMDMEYKETQADMLQNNIHEAKSEDMILQDDKDGTEGFIMRVDTHGKMEKRRKFWYWTTYMGEWVKKWKIWDYDIHTDYDSDENSNEEQWQYWYPMSDPTPKHEECYDPLSNLCYYQWFKK